MTQCLDCKFFDSSTQPADKQADTHGVCRKLPPTADDRTGHARWAFVEDTDWCGAFEAPEKVVHPDDDIKF